MLTALKLNEHCDRLRRWWDEVVKIEQTPTRQIDKLAKV
jgi:hypothetical protein